jgi:hypothetical protein
MPTAYLEGITELWKPWRCNDCIWLRGDTWLGGGNLMAPPMLHTYRHGRTDGHSWRTSGFETLARRDAETTVSYASGKRGSHRQPGRIGVGFPDTREDQNVLRSYICFSQFSPGCSGLFNGVLLLGFFGWFTTFMRAGYGIGRLSTW